ncbi:DUF6896 domain-containing protein [Longispora urticae]
MNMSDVAVVECALDSFRKAREHIFEAFGKPSASELVSAVLAGEIPRRGKLPNGLEYFVHGIGYTVVLGTGSHVHVDASEMGDSFSVYDIDFFFKSDDAEIIAPELLTITEICDRLVIGGTLGKVGERHYVLDPNLRGVG